MPYIYSAFYQAHEKGIPVARSLAIYHPHDEKIYHSLYENQYFFGPDIMVAPVASKVNLAKVYFPEGEWYDLYDDTFYQGKQEAIVECPIEKLPVFVKASAIIPMQEKLQNLSNNFNDCLHLHIYNGKEDNNMEYYEDDGETFDHVSGKYYKRLIEFKPDKRQLILHPKEGEYETQYKSLKVFFHGFEGKLNEKININEKSISLGKSDFHFIEQISNFDPLPESERLNLTVSALPQATFNLEDERLNIEY
jgi:alpha-glucosidase